MYLSSSYQICSCFYLETSQFSDIFPLSCYINLLVYTRLSTHLYNCQIFEFCCGLIEKKNI